MSTPIIPLFAQFPALAKTVPWVQLIPSPTPVAPLRAIAAAWHHPELYVKREDFTSLSYGGNKVRNLEFILGDALARGARSVVTVAPLGSNFIGALAAQARQLKLGLEVAHFIVSRNPQIDAHARFSADQGAKLTLFAGRRGSVPAALQVAARCVSSRLQGEPTYFISPGGSSLRGALGHVNALLELQQQVRREEIPPPDIIVVGAGTCGTIAGLLAGLAATGQRTRVIGVRCVDRLICNRGAIVSLTNRVLGVLGAPARIFPQSFDLVDLPADAGYSLPSPEAEAIMSLFAHQEGVPLDTTYTSKIALWLKRALAQGGMQGKRILYWHTFSPAALRWSADRARPTPMPEPERAGVRAGWPVTAP